VGDSRQEFTIQSISKRFVFGLAFARHGRERVMERVGVEPSGNAFNAISVDATNRPFNPMVNAGAIVTPALLDGVDPATRLEQLLDGLAGFAG
jgi:glutaminase